MGKSKKVLLRLLGMWVHADDNRQIELLIEWASVMRLKSWPSGARAWING